MKVLFSAFWIPYISISCLVRSEYLTIATMVTGQNQPEYSIVRITRKAHITVQLSTLYAI